MIERKAKRKRKTVDDRALDSAARTYPGFSSYERMQRVACTVGYLAGWRAAKREAKR
jgi:hypothetical protein